MLELARKYLEELNAFDTTMAPILRKITNAIPYETVPERMKATIAVSEVMTFASQFRRNVLHWDGTEVPVNSIGCVITASGENKDSSVRAARKCLSTGYEMIERKRKTLAIEAAKQAATDAMEETPGEPETYLKYYTSPAPVFMSPTTGPGLVQHINDIGTLPIGSGTLYTGELGDELAQSNDMLENIKTLSEVYDVGDKEIKYTKGVESRSKEIKSQPVSALLVGSPTYILYDEPTKKKFQISFNSKLARRTWFCYIPNPMPLPQYSSMEEEFEAEEAIELEAIKARTQISKGIEAVTAYQLPKHGKTLSVAHSVSKIFKAYKRYNTELVNATMNANSVAALVRKHLQWKALKLAGALAIFELSDEVTDAHYIQAIQFCELLSEDMPLFENELNKAQYERFADYMRKSVDNDGIFTMTIHDLKKSGFISSTANSRTKLLELVTPANVYDTDGVFTITDDNTSITYQKIMHTDSVPISFKPVDNSKVNHVISNNLGKEALTAAKTSVAASAVYGYTVADTTFEELGDLLAGDFAYCAFKLKDGIRGKDNIVSGTKVIVLDVDESTITAEECSFILQGFNHHIALTSDPDNDLKFRAIIELDALVDLNPIEWKHFHKSVADYLSLKVDPLPQSQVMFSYSGRTVYSVTNQSPLEVKDHLMFAKDKSASKALSIDKKLSTAQCAALLSDELTTFASAFECEDGRGSLELIKAAYYARDLQMTREEIIELMYRINNYWTIPMDEDRLRNTIIAQIQRW